MINDWSLRLNLSLVKIDSIVFSRIKLPSNPGIGSRLKKNNAAFIMPIIYKKSAILDCMLWLIILAIPIGPVKIVKGNSPKINFFRTTLLKMMKSLIDLKLFKKAFGKLKEFL